MKFTTKFLEQALSTGIMQYAKNQSTNHHWVWNFIFPVKDKHFMLSHAMWGGADKIQDFRIQGISEFECVEVTRHAHVTMVWAVPLTEPRSLITELAAKCLADLGLAGDEEAQAIIERYLTIT